MPHNYIYPPNGFSQLLASKYLQQGYPLPQGAEERQIVSSALNAFKKEVMSAIENLLCSPTETNADALQPLGDRLRQVNNLLNRLGLENPPSSPDNSQEHQVLVQRTGYAEKTYTVFAPIGASEEEIQDLAIELAANDTFSSESGSDYEADLLS